MSTTANYAATPRCGIAQVSVANTNRDGTGTLATVFTAGSNGSRIDDVQVKAVGNTTAGMVRLYIHDGTNARLITEIAVSAVTPSATTAAFEGGITLSESLPTGYSLRASVHNAETLNVFAFGGDF